MNDYKVIALALVDATKNVLLKDCCHPAFLESYRNNLAVIVGSGKATYFKPSISHPLITYGIKMMASGMSSINEASGWRHSRELIKYGFFGGNVTAQTFLASVAMHEFAHFVVFLKFGPKNRIVHGPQFERVLNELYRSGLSDKLMSYLMNVPAFKNASIDKVNAEGTKSFGVAVFDHNTISVGDSVTFLIRGETKTQVVKKVSDKSISTWQYRVPYGLISRAEKIGSVGVVATEKTKSFGNVGYDRNNVSVKDLVTFIVRGEAKTQAVLRVNDNGVTTEQYRIPYGLISSVQKRDSVGENETKYTRKDVAVGDIVDFDHNGEMISEKVTRVNEKSVTTDSFRVYYNVIKGVKKALAA